MKEGRFAVEGGEYAVEICTDCCTPVFSQKIAAATDPIQSVDMLYQAVRKVWGGECIVTPLKPSAADLSRVREALQNCDTVILGTCNALLYPEQQELTRLILAELDRTKILVAMDSPYDIEVFPGAENVICTYGAVAASMEAAVKVMTGQLKGDAVPPVTIRLSGNEAE